MSLVSVIWILIYAPGPDGMLNAFLDAVTFGTWAPRDFLRDPAWAFPAIMLLSVWQGVGFQMVILLAGLQAIPDQLYEAAALAVDAIKELLDTIKVSYCLADYDIPIEDLPKLVDGGMKQARLFVPNPRDLAQEDVKLIYEGAF